MSNDEHPRRRQWLLARLAEADGVTYDSLCHDVIEAFQVRAKGRSRSQLRYQHYASSTRGVLGQYGESWDDEGHTNITECIPYHNDDPALPGAEDRRLAREAGTEGQHQRAGAWFGWRPSTAAAGPRTAAGKRCRHHDYGDECICSRHRSVLDHPRVWLAQDGERVFTAEPYDVDGTEFAALVADCTTIGLGVTVHGRSPYYPGRTVLIVICR